MDWLSADAFSERYEPSEGMPLGNAKYVLHPHNSPYYYDTARTGGVGGKANTRNGAQNARFRGTQLHAGRRVIEPGDEIFVPYGGDYHFGGGDIDDERQDWIFARRGRPTGSRSSASSHMAGSTPAPPLSDGSVFQRTRNPNM